MSNKGLSHHGLYGSQTYNSWAKMIQRCRNPKKDSYHRYGGRGIKVCKRWLLFENFLADMGIRPCGMTLDRKNNNGNYGPSNCQWATYKQQRLNQDDVFFITFNGEKMCKTDWARKLGIAPSTLDFRLRMWPIEKALGDRINE